MQRILSKTKYDHIALVLKSDEETVWCYEALNGEGVVLRDWELFSKTKKSFNQFLGSFLLSAFSRLPSIVLRRLTVPDYEVFNE